MEWRQRAGSMNQGGWTKARQLAGRGFAGMACAMAVGCAHTPPDGVPSVVARPAPSAWSSFALPGKRSTVYQHVLFEGRPAIQAVAEGSASMYRQRLALDRAQIGSIDFSWWVPALMPAADLSDRERADSPVRVVLAFDGDVSRLSRKDRMMFELAETLTGEAPPYATLMYVWDTRSPAETVIPGGRSNRIRKIVVDSGTMHLKSWRHHRRDIASDFERAFGEAPGRLVGIALMTDSDNTASRANAIYGSLLLTSPDGKVRSFDE